MRFMGGYWVWSALTDYRVIPAGGARSTCSGLTRMAGWAVAIWFPCASAHGGIVRTAASRLRQLASGRARRQPGAGRTTAPAAPAAGIVIDPGVIPLVMGTLRTPETSRRAGP